MGLPIDYYPRVMRALDLLGQGETVTSAVDLAGIEYNTFKRYVAATPELQEAFNAAEQRGFDVMADSLVKIDTTCAIAGVSDPKVMKVLSDNIRWYLSRKRPNQYGERVTVTHNITADKTIVDALTRGKERALNHVVEDVTYTVVEQVLLPGTDTVLDVDGMDEDLLALV